MKQYVNSYVGALLTICLVVVACYYLYEQLIIALDNEQIDFSNVSISNFLIATAICMFANIINTYLWHSINCINGHNTSFSTSYKAWSASRLIRYIPGKVLTYIVRHKLQKSSTKISLMSSLNEALFNYFPVLVLLILYVFSKHMLIATFAILIATISIINLKTVLRTTTRTFKIKALNSEQLFFNSSSSMSLLCISTTATLIHGLSFYVLMHNYTANLSYLNAITAFYLSAIIGQLAIFSPAGLIVREATIVLFLTSINIESSIAILGATLSRLSLISSEIIHTFISSFLKSNEKT